jgi:hypothetical protein
MKNTARKITTRTANIADVAVMSSNNQRSPTIIISSSDARPATRSMMIEATAERASTPRR